MRCSGKHRQEFWARALIVGLVLTAEIQLFSVEILHHHTEDARICRIEHEGGTYLHAGQQLTPLCPICQIVRNGSARPAVQSQVQHSNQESTFRPVTRPARYTPNLTQSLLARAPPLS